MASKGLAFLAGAGEGLVEGERLRRASDIENRKLALTEKQITAAESKARQDALMGQVKTLDDSFTGLVSNVEKMLTAQDVSPQALAAAASLRDSATAGYKMLEDKGVLPAGTYDSRRAIFDTVLKTGVSSLEKAKRAAAGTMAETEAVADALGVDVSQVAQAKGLLPKPPEPTKAQSEVGKITSDLRGGFITQAQADAQLNKLAGSEDTFKNLQSLRKEFTGDKSVQEFVQTRDAFGTVLASAAPDPRTGKTTAAGDLSLVFAYMKMLDPGSTVREGEYATAQSAAGVPSQVANIYNQLVQGKTTLPENLRADYVSRAGILFNRRRETLEKVTIPAYQKIAKANKFDPEQVTIDLVGGFQMPAAAPPVATPAPAPAARPPAVPAPELPPGIPPGSTLLGTSGGKPVYQTPDGKKLMVE